MKTRIPSPSTLAALCTIAMVAAAPSPSLAGVKYWDKPGFRDYDVGDYVQDGLVVNYDGIRNAGPDAPHDSSALTWVNCANPGTYDQTRYSLVNSAWQAGDAKGEWTDDGFVFNTNALFHQGTSFTVPATYTMQTLVDAKASKQTPMQPNGTVDKIGYVMCDYNASHWSSCSIGIRRDNYSFNGIQYQYSFYLVTAGGDTKARPALGSSSDVTFNYATAIGNGSSGSVFFSGTEAPWSASGSQNGRSTTAISEVSFNKGFSIGGHYTNVKEYFSGTIKNFRIYNRYLSDSELLWNRVVDEARYFGRSREITVIPVTNVVESCSIEGIRDYHYAIDTEGQTFTAPAQRTVNGKRHVLSGYTLKTWNGTEWGDPISHDGDFSYTATDTTALVCITWQYTAANEGKLKTYDVDDYVTDGLALHFDGIHNAGKNVAHDCTVDTWKNLGSETGYDLSLIRTYGTIDDNVSAWGDDGFDFVGGSRFNNNDARTWGPSYTIQILVDADIASQQHATSANYIFGTVWTKCAIGIYRDYMGVCLHTQNANAKPYGPYTTGATSVDYTTAVLDGTNLRASITDGTTIPTDGSKTTCTEYTAVASLSNGMNLGGWGGAVNQYFIGRLKNFRAYTRVLTEDELAHNRRVDNYRYFGINEPETTNVVVTSTYSYLEGYDKCGAYEVEGSYTFVAPATVVVDGVTYTNTGYTVETQDGIGWANTTHYDSHSYLYNTNDGTIRLTWEWKAVNALRTAADYSFDDLSPAGLALHYDGLLNQGVGVDRSTTSTTWVNLGSRPGMDLTRKNATGFSPSWGAKGHVFPGRSMFESSASVPWPTTFSAQVLVDAKHSDNRNAKGHYIAATTWCMFGMQIDGANNRGRFYMQSYKSGDNTLASEVTFDTEDGIDYMTVIHDAKTQSALTFPGVEMPTTSPGYKHFDTFNGLENNKFRLGGWGGGTDVQCLVGTIYTFRYYDRVLTEEELVRNRNVDASRYFGALGVTNVVVEVEADSGITSAETADTAYFVEGEYTFTATGGAGLGYRLSVPDGNGGWQVQQSFVEGTTYTYTDGTSPALVKLEWRTQKPFVLIVR